MKAKTVQETSYRNFDFHKLVGEDEEAREAFHKAAHAALRDVARLLGLKEGEYDLRSERIPTGYESGHAILHADNFHVDVCQMRLGHDRSMVQYRRCNGRDDHLGERSMFVDINALQRPQNLANHIRILLNQGNRKGRST